MFEYCLISYRWFFYVTRQAFEFDHVVLEKIMYVFFLYDIR